jgi:xanthine dehydrogenase FAD-binding subunit
MLTCDDYLIPKTLPEAFAQMARHRGEHRIVAGCTDTLPWAREGRAGDVHVPVLIDISQIPELNERKVHAGSVRLGAAMPFQRFLDDAALVAAMPGMPRCAVWFADDQIRAQATIGGNVVNASPAADGTPCLLAHSAVVELARDDDGRIVRRRMPLAQFLLGPNRTALQDGELLVALECDALQGYGGSFEKVGHRRSLVISTVCLAALLKLDSHGQRIKDVRLALAGVCSVPLRLHDTERFLRGKVLDRETLEAAADIPVALVASRTRQEYRRDVVRGFVIRGLVNAAQRADADPAALNPDLEAVYA